MSFSSDIKQELNKSNSLANKENVKFELIGYLISGNIDIIKGKNVKFHTESDYNINRFSKLLSNLEINHEIKVDGKGFSITTKALDINNLEFLETNENQIILKKQIIDVNIESRKRAVIRGAFLGSGSISNPENSYHLEIVFGNDLNLEVMKKIFESLDISVKELIKRNRYSLYIKDGEEISKLLALICANKSVMLFEDIRIKKEMRGKVNRIVNCETANLNKTINAAIEQIEAINKLKENGKFNKLDDNLKELANLRIEYPNMSLIELGKKLKNPVGKSGVNYRLKKIMEIANGQ